ncbi:unnamed protein product [Medioppia subpectinata]|uniref:Uncharacterized protein n=1 Tax=Medioppia subpectinata TaxID=1979941 RepID=A0A7R9Q6Z8_9ACAR|nr:unnamed protein product [Medioppia subpectinata]CAG2115333.1 unnamed protein product [Medioppia subpectinata]
MISQQENTAYVMDKNTGEELSIKVNTYYSIQNLKTQRYMIWFGRNGTIADVPETKQGRFWHTFTMLATNHTNRNQHWYKLNHYFGSHVVKVAKTHDEDNGDNPVGDWDEFGTLKCVEPKPDSDHLYDTEFIS